MYICSDKNQIKYKAAAALHGINGYQWQASYWYSQWLLRPYAIVKRPQAIDLIGGQA